MYLTKEIKKNIFGEYGSKDSDSGSPESQVALFTFRINHLTGHLRSNKKDHNTRRSLIAIVGKRRRLLNYLKTNDIERYRSVISKLNIRK